MLCARAAGSSHAPRALSRVRRAQDLLAPSAASGIMEENLAIRENPSKGFYVEGLHEYIVRSYEEVGADVAGSLSLAGYGLRGRTLC